MLDCPWLVPHKTEKTKTAGRCFTCGGRLLCPYSRYQRAECGVRMGMLATFLSERSLVASYQLAGLEQQARLLLEQQGEEASDV